MDATTLNYTHLERLLSPNQPTLVRTFKRIMLKRFNLWILLLSDHNFKVLLLIELLEASRTYS